MFKKIVKTYYKILDEKLENGTMVVLIIAALIVSASLITKDANAFLYVKTNVQETSKTNLTSSNTIMVDGIQYKITLEEISK